MADLFEHYVGNELVRHTYLLSRGIKVKYWRDAAGPEVDYVIDASHRYIPIEVKWSDKPGETEAKHIKKFLTEYSEAEKGYIICRTPYRYQLTDQITVLPWQELKEAFNFELSI